MKYKYGMREHRGGLKESLETSKYFDELKFNELVSKYEFYCVDERCNQILFIAKNMGRKYLWLFVEVEEMSDYGKQ